MCIFPGALQLFIVTFVRYCHVCRPHWLHWIEPKISGMTLLTVIMGLFYSVADAFFARLYDQNEITGNKSLICSVRPTHIGSALLSRSKYIIVIMVIVALVILNILIIIKNCRTKIAMRTNSQVNMITSTELLEKQENVRKSSNLHEFLILLMRVKHQTHGMS